MTSLRRTSLKVGAFIAAMLVLTGALFAIFGQYRSGSGNHYSAVFTDVSRLEVGDTVRAAGIQVGTVSGVSMQPDKTVVVTFDADSKVVLTTATTVAVRYLNLVGDRFLELVDSPGSTRVLPAGAHIPVDRTMPALNLDLLLGGLKPVIEGLNPQDVNALTASLLEVLQGQGDTLTSLLSRTSSFTTALADNSAVVEQVIDNLNTVVGTLNEDGEKFSATVQRLEQLATGLAEDRDSIGDAIEALDDGTTSIADLLGAARPPLAGTVDELNRMAPLLDMDKDRIDLALQKAPDNYRKLIRLGSYGSFVNYYLCGISFRVSDLQGQTALFPWIKQETGRCAED